MWVAVSSLLYLALLFDCYLILHVILLLLERLWIIKLCFYIVLWIRLSQLSFSVFLYLYCSVARKMS